MSHGPQHRYMEKFACFHIGSAVKTANHGSSCTPEAGRMALGPAEAEFHQCIRGSHTPHAAALGSNETFMVHDHGKTCFQNHGFHSCSFEAEQQFSRESHRSFRHGINISGKVEMGEVIQKFRIENIQTSEVIDIFFAVGEILYKIHQMGKARYDGISAAKWILTVKTVKYHLSEKSIGHGELV